MSQQAPSVRAGDSGFLATRRGKLTLALVCLAAFLDVVDITIVNVALPSIRDDVGFSAQNLQWVASGYLLTYGGFLLLGGRAADLLGRRRLLVTGTSLFGLSSLTCALAGSEGVLVGARLAQGMGAAMMTPAALSILTTTFPDGPDRHKAIGVWSATIPLASVLGVVLGGVLADGPGWRWVFLVNVPLCAIVVAGAFRLLDGERPPARLRNFDAVGAILVTAGMLLLVHALVEAPEVGWGEARTIAELAAALALLLAFAANERRQRNPLFPFSILRVKGLAAADATQVIANAGFFAMFFFLTLYMQTVLGYSPIEAGVAYIPVTICVGLASGVATKLVPGTGTRPLIVAGTLLGAGGIFWLSRIPVAGSYVADILPGLAVMAVGLGAVFVGVTNAANAGVPTERAGLAAALLNTAQQLGGALGIAILSALATSRTQDLLAAGAARPEALTAGFERAFIASSMCLLAAAVIASRATNTNKESTRCPSRNTHPPLPLPAPMSRHGASTSSTRRETASRMA
jgi:EmrB/QacA subfamily drug resistance transporter